jgi:hypothetical protein
MATAEKNVIECIMEHPDFDKAIILVDGHRLTPEESLKVRKHSPAGFAWGYGGSGPAQLALAILLRCGVPAGTAQRVHQDFKFEFIGGLPQNNGWRFEVNVHEWVENKLAERA